MQSSKKQSKNPSATKEGFSEAGTENPILIINKRLDEIQNQINNFDCRLKKVENTLLKMGEKTVPCSKTENKNLQLRIVSLVKKMGETQDKNMKEWREAQEIGKAMIKEEVVRLLKDFQLIRQSPTTSERRDKAGDIHQEEVEETSHNAMHELGESVELVTLTDSEKEQNSAGSNSVPNFGHLPSWTIPKRLRNDQIDFHIKDRTKRVIIPSKNKISEEKLDQILTGLKALLELDIGQISWNVVKAMTKLQLDSIVILHLNGIELSDDNLQNILSKQLNHETRFRRMNGLRILTLAGLNVLTDLSLEYVATYASNLKKLTLSNCDKCTDKGIEKLVNTDGDFSVNLVELSLESCNTLTNQSLIHLVKCRNLTKLKVLEIPAITVTFVETFNWGRNEKGSVPCQVMFY